MIHRFFSQFGFLFLSLHCLAQAPANYPRHYFANPLKVPISLAANFGELRPNHFHMGLDIRTEKKENLPVYAAAEGYIARIKIEPFGFGQAIYINHPNGFTTVYAHLNGFFPALVAYIKKQQYRQETWKITIDMPPSLFPVRKGEWIGYSGNTGGSQGPHLHFEIRSTADDTNLNPMLFGLPIADNTEPQIQRLAIYDATRSVYEQSPRLLPLVRKGVQFSTGKDTLFVPYPRIALSIGATDTQSGSDNPNGIYEAAIFEDDHEVIRFLMDRISYLYTRNINGHVDFKTKAQGGPWLQQLFLLPGLDHSIYQTIGGNGTIDLSDGAVHSIRIQVRDAYGNGSVCNQNFQFSGQGPGLPHSAGQLFYPGMLEPVEQEDCAFIICENCLYDSVHISYSRSASLSAGSVSALHSIGNDYIPLQEPLTVRIMPIRILTDREKQKVVIQRTSGEDLEIQKAAWQGNWASGRFRDFGNYQLILDTLPPQIRLLRSGRKGKRRQSGQIAFEVKDNLESIKNVRATVDGKWILCTNDKQKAFIYKKDEHWQSGKHELQIEAEDEAGNKVRVSFEIDGR